MNYLALDKKQGPRDREHLLPEHAQENPWKVVLAAVSWLPSLRARFLFV